MPRLSIQSFVLVLAAGCIHGAPLPQPTASAGSIWTESFTSSYPGLTIIKERVWGLASQTIIDGSGQTITSTSTVLLAADRRKEYRGELFSTTDSYADSWA